MFNVLNLGIGLNKLNKWILLKFVNKCFKISFEEWHVIVHIQVMVLHVYCCNCTLSCIVYVTLFHLKLLACPTFHLKWSHFWLKIVVEVLSVSHNCTVENLCVLGFYKYYVFYTSPILDIKSCYLKRNSMLDKASVVNVYNSASTEQLQLIAIEILLKKLLPKKHHYQN